MRERFLVWHNIRLLAMAVMALLASEVFLGPLVPDDIFRNKAKLLALDVGILVAAPFLLSYIEDGVLGPWLKRALKCLPIIVLPVCFIPIFALNEPILNTIRHLVFVVVIIVIVATLIQAVRRGSRAARFQSAAWVLIMVVCGIAVVHELAFNSEWGLWSSAILIALTLEVVVSAVGVSDRFMGLRRERDEAVARETFLAHIAATDVLTALPNRRGFEAQIGRNDQPLPSAVAVVDLDHFKHINDTHSHDIGDQVLRAVATVLNHPSVFAARIGGEEFALLLYGEDPIIDAESVRNQIANIDNRQINALSTPVTASIGVCLLSEDSSHDAAMLRADDALYLAKNSGRNRVVSVSIDENGDTELRAVAQIAA